MSFRGQAAIVGVADYKSERTFTGPRQFSLEQWADLSARSLADAGIESHEVNGLVCVGDTGESAMFHPATIAEYCGWSVDFAERVDLGGASAVAAVWRAAAAIELGMCDVVVVTCTGRPRPDPPAATPQARARSVNASSWIYGSPQAEFEVPFGDVPPNIGFAMYATRYHALYGADHWARAKIAADQRTSASVNPSAVFFGKPITTDEVLDSRMIADPLHIFEIVMLCHGGASVVLASKERAQRCPKRDVFVTGCGEHLSHKTPTYSVDEVPLTPISHVADKAFAMSGLSRRDIDMVQLYDCYTITVLLTIEQSGFCGAGEGMQFLREHDLSYKGDFPCNTHGGMLGAGQPGFAGGMSMVVEAARQIQGVSDNRQLRRHDTAYVSGTGGIMSEQAALILQGA
ncbi:MAG TPA: thiolase family protein [Acidimicrobiales bacterium]|nr:thiolase family protein [Acidimicrobiales bacterium]